MARLEGARAGPFSHNSLYNCNYRVRRSEERNGLALRDVTSSACLEGLSLMTEVLKFIKLLQSRRFTPPPPLRQIGQAANCLDRKTETLERVQSLPKVQTSTVSFWPLSVPTPQEECALLSPACLLHCTPCALSRLFPWRSQRPDICRETRAKFP